jgi:RNA polymerase sigma-70 factor, ECF subfamily
VATLPCGDAPRMGHLLLRLEPRLTAVARRLVRNPDAATNVVQNAFEKVLRYCEQFRGVARPSTWMHRVVVNEAFMWLRREKRSAPTRIHPEDWELVFPPTGNPEQAVATRQDQARIERALARLPEPDRRLLTASALEGRPYEALGRELGSSTGAVKSRAFRARRRLAAELETT